MYDKLALVALILTLTACEGTIEVPKYDPQTGEPLGSPFADPAGDGNAGGGTSTGPTAGGAPVEESASAANHPGKPLYDQHCSACHGPAGAGSAVWPEPIAGFEPIADIVANGQGGMPPVAISADETADIQGYLLALVEAAENGEEQAPAQPVDISNLNGLEVYELRCAVCHGDEGQGTEQGFQLRYRADEYSKYVVTTGRASAHFASDMPAYDDISEAQLDEMFDWLGSFPNPESAEGLYGRYCANCHGDDARGGPTGKDIASKSDSTEYIRGGENLDHPGSRREFMPRWNVEQISDAEVDAINQYVSSLPE